LYFKNIYYKYSYVKKLIVYKIRGLVYPRQILSSNQVKKDFKIMLLNKSLIYLKLNKKKKVLNVYLNKHLIISQNF
jgi:hypothetical protein